MAHNSTPVTYIIYISNEIPAASFVLITFIACGINANVVKHAAILPIIYLSPILIILFSKFISLSFNLKSNILLSFIHYSDSINLNNKLY